MIAVFPTPGAPVTMNLQRTSHVTLGPHLRIEGLRQPAGSYNMRYNSIAIRNLLPEEEGWALRLDMGALGCKVCLKGLWAGD